MRYIIRTQVTEVREVFIRKYISGHGPSATFEQQSRGWFVYFQGSYEALCVGPEMPDLKEGDPIIISIEKADGWR